MRKLVTLRRIKDIQPIPNADAIEVATVDGWKVVVKKGEFKINDLVIYFEIDSVLPQGREEFEFLMPRGCKSWTTEDNDTLVGHRLRSIKLRGQVSQGLIIPVDPKVVDIDFDTEGDMSHIFGVKKYEMPISPQMAGQIRGNYPGWLPKTDQERVQNCHDVIPPGLYTVEEKMEGSSMTIYHDSESLGVTSRNVDLKLDQEGNIFVDLAKDTGLFEGLTNWSVNNPGMRIAIRGELLGPGVQGNIYRNQHNIFHIFDIWIDGEYLTYAERSDFFEAHLLPHVNRNHTVDFAKELFRAALPVPIETLIALADGQSGYFPTLREGLVFKSTFRTPSGVFSFKSVSQKYLLAEKQ
jgi:RNA ligase (TIGR02306 family)